MKRILTYCAVVGAVTLGGILLFGQNYPVCNPPSITTQPASQIRTQYQNVSFSVAIDPATTTPVSYQWRSNGVNLVESDRISAVTTPTLTIFELTPSDAANYDVVISNSCVNGVTNSAAAVLTVVTANPSDMILLLQGRNPQVGTVPDTGGNLINLQVFTPLK